MAGRLARVVAPGAGFALVYALAILVGRATKVEGSQVSLFWPAAAVAVLWGLYATSRGRVLAITHGALLTVLPFAVALATGDPPELAAWCVLVNLALAGVTVAVLRHRGRPVALREPADLGCLVVAVSAGTLAAATLAVPWLAHEQQEPLGHTFALYAIRDGVTALTGVAVVLRLRDAQWRRHPPTATRGAESVLLSAVTVVVFARVFWFNQGHPNAFGVMLPAMWVSLRYSTTTSTVFLSGSGVLIAWATLLGPGTFSEMSPAEQALMAQGLVGTLTIVVLTLALFRDSRNELIAELRERALHDPLTGLANRSLLNDRLEQDLAVHPPGTVGVIVLDLDGFKAVNDAWGHIEGDLLLVEMARRLRAAVRQGDTVVRLGGDEFVVLCPGLADRAELHRCAERVRERIALPYDQLSGAPDDWITASVGTAVSEPTSTARSLLAAADRAMYDAKRAGRNRTADASFPVRTG